MAAWYHGVCSHVCFDEIPATTIGCQPISLVLILYSCSAISHHCHCPHGLPLIFTGFRGFPWVFMGTLWQIFIKKKIHRLVLKHDRLYFGYAREADPPTHFYNRQNVYVSGK